MRVVGDMRARLLFGWCTAGFLGVTLSLGPGAGVRAASPTADLVLLGGKIITMDRQFSTAQADTISSDHPIWVQYLYSEAMMNRAAMTAVGLTAETKDPFGGKVLKDTSGQPTGVVTGFGGINAFYFKIPRPAPEDQVSSTRDWFRELNRL